MTKRLNQFLAQSLGLTRKQADQVIKNGSVKINGLRGELFNQVGSDDMVQVNQDGNWVDLNNRDEKTIILAYKPVLYAIESKNPKLSTLMKLVPAQYRHFKAINKIDYNSEGVVVLVDKSSHDSVRISEDQITTKQYVVGVNTELNLNALFALVDELHPTAESFELLNAKKFEPKNNYPYLRLNSKILWYVFEVREDEINRLRLLLDLLKVKVNRVILVSWGDFRLSAELYQKRLVLTNAES